MTEAALFEAEKNFGLLETVCCVKGPWFVSKDWGQCQRTVFFVKALGPASVDHGLCERTGASI